MGPPLVLTFKLTLPQGHGREVLRASLDGRIVGALYFNLTAGSVIWIHWLEIAPADRRQGIASALLSEVGRRFPGATFDTGGLTAEGILFEEARGQT